MFWHEIDGGSSASGPLIGLGLGFLGCLSFSTGNMIAARVQRDGVSVLSANAWGVTYGVAVNVLVALVAGSAFIIEPTPRYVVSLLWLAMPGSVLAFWMYLSLLGRIGADRAGYTAVLAAGAGAAPLDLSSRTIAGRRWPSPASRSSRRATCWC